MKINKEESLCELKEKMSDISRYILYFWIMCMLVLFFGISWLSLFRGVEIINFNLDNLNKIGGFFNIVTSLAAVATVYLVSRAVIYQKTELMEIKKQMIEQKISIEKSDAINRAIPIIEDWRNLSENLGKLSGNEKSFIEKTFYLYNEDTVEKIDFRLISKFLIDDGVTKKIERQIKEIDGDIKTKKYIIEDRYSDEEINGLELESINTFAAKIEEQRQHECEYGAFDDENEYIRIRDRIKLYESFTALDEAKQIINDQIDNFLLERKPLDDMLKNIENAYRYKPYQST